MKKYLLLLALVCLLGNRALAQTKSASNTSFTHEVIDFTQLGAVGGLGNSSWDENYLVSVNGTTLSSLSSKRISVSNTDGWNIWTSDQNQCSYFQRSANEAREVYINNLNVGDIVRIWCQGDCYILTDNTATHDSNNSMVWNHNDPNPNSWESYPTNSDSYPGVQLAQTLYRNGSDQDGWTVIDQNPNGNELRIVNDHNNGTLVIRLASLWAGILKVEIDAVNTTAHYDYDPGFEVYDMFETRKVYDNGNLVSDNTGYSANESAGFKLNNKDAKYLKFTNNDLSLNERIAIDPTSTWTFARGLQAPNYSLVNDDWYNLSICNLREGDRVVIYYTGDAPIFSSNGKNGSSSSGSGGGNEGGIELTKPTNSQALPISEILGHTSNTSDIITFYFNTNNYYDGLDIGYLQSSNNSNNTQYRFNTSNVSSNGDFQLYYTVQDLINIAGSNNDGIMANVYNATLSRVALTTLNGSPISSSSSSSSSSGSGYTGSAAYKDTWNDGMLDTSEGDYEIKLGDPVEYSYCRDEGNIARDENTSHVWLYTSYPYVMMENGHLDLALRNGNRTRIVKIKIYSDHQAMMVDDYNTDHTYTSYFNITGELQAKEHIVPGGLEVHVGSDDADQHANVVFSKEGPVSYVKAVDSFKIPGIYKDNNEQIQNNFNLANEAPTTGTYYTFIPETNGKMTVRFKATSLNYYRWDLTGDAIYYNESGWTEEFDRANEWPMDRKCPYYLMVKDGDSYSSASFYVDDNTSNLSNGPIYKNNEYCTLTLNVEAGKTYYLYGTWDQNKNDGNSIGSTSANLNDRPACGIAELLWVNFSPDNYIYPLAKWVPNGTTDVNNKNNNNYVLNPDDLTTKEYELATVKGYDNNNITVKKMSGNITACHPYIEYAEGSTEGKLMIDGITFADGKNEGGTILIKIGDSSVKTDPVYALTIAYSAAEEHDKDNADGSRGHTWDFSTKSLNGLTWGNNGYPTATDQGVFNRENDNDSKYAVTTDYGHYFANYFGTDISNYRSKDEVLANLTKSGSGLLYEEISGDDSDWMFNYNLKYGDQLYDPVFTNKYDMEGDNADMVWETEGTVFQTSANQSCIFNEYGKTITHTSSETVDPDRYVGFFEGSKFRIPWLMKNDRVIIYMGTGTGRYADEVKFKIKHAYDALHNEISENDEYIVGGSHWDGTDGDPYYRGCYHFFATGNPNDATKPADMVFEMTSGSMCKIYNVQIYRGDRIITNEIVGATENDNKYFLWSRAYDPNDSSDKKIEGVDGYEEEGYTDTHNYNWGLKYLGKDQQLANGTGKNSQENEIIAQTGYYKSGNPALANNFVKVSQENTETGETEEIATSKVESFTYQHALGEIGTFRMRGKDMEKNMNYVADYADHNVTIAYQQTQPYPYTWDFTDVTGIQSNVTDYFDPEEQLGEGTTAPTGSGLTDDIWNSLDAESYQKTARDLSLWEVYSTGGNYFLRLNSQTSQTRQNPMERDNIFESAKEIGGNQVWANKTIVPEMQGLWFYTEDYDQETGKSYDNLQSNGEWIIKKADANNVGGLEVTTGNCPWFNKIVVPNVPANAAVYLRMKKLSSSQYEAKVRYMFGQQESMSEISTTSETSTSKTFYGIGNDDYILAIMNTNDSKSNLTLSLYGYRIQKLAVSTDPKAIGKTGYATESRARRIDHTLTSFLTGKNIKAYTASYGSITGSTDPDYSRVVLKEFDKPSLSGSAHGQENGGCILYHAGGTSTDRSVSILDGGFHLFVPDMHDGKDADGNDIATNDVDVSNNILIAFNPTKDACALTNLATGYIGPDATDGQKTLVLSAKKYKYGTNGADVQEGYDVSFVRVDPKGNTNQGASLKDCSAYIKMPASQMKVLSDNNGGQAKSIIVFCDDLFGEINNGIATGISEVNEENGVNGKAEWYSLDGQKLNGVPTAKGLYIVNGKKVLVK